MAKTLQHRRGTTTELASVTGAVGEIFMDTTKKTLVVMDGTTPGGTPLALEGSGGGTGGSYDQSLNTTNDVVFNSALLGDVSVIGNTISGVDSYGNADTLIVDGDLQVNGALINAATLTLNVDGSKSVVVDSLVSTTETVSGGTSQFNISFGMAGTKEFSYSPMGSDVLDASKFVTGTIVTITNSTGIVYSSVIQLDSNMTYSAMNNKWSAPFTVISGTSGGAGFSAGSVTVTNSSGSVVNYGFDDQGTFTTTNVATDTALIGDLTIVGNNIAALDSYGNPAELSISATDVVFDNSVNLSVNSLVSTTETISNANYFDLSGGYFRNTNVPSTWADASKFVTGSLVTISGMGNTGVIQLTSDMIYTGMANGWQASYTSVSGSPSSPFSSVVVTNSSGATTSYSFDDQGVFTAPTVSTTELLVNGSPAGLLTINQDGSKTIEVPKLVTTSYSGLYWVQASLSGTMSPSYQGKLRFQSPNQTVINLFSSLVVGDKVTLTRNLMPSGTQEYTFTVQTAGFSYDMMSNNYVLDVVETNNTMDEYYFSYSYAVSVETIGSQEYNFAGDGLTVSNIIADSALIGDVSIVGNTISGVDSYGLASNLILEGTVVYAGETSEIPVTPGSVNKWLKVGAQVPSTILVVSEYDSINWMNGALYNSGTKTLSFDGITGTFQTVLQSLSVGDTLRIYVPTYGSWFTLSLSSQFTEQGSPGPWTASVNEDVFGTPDTASISLVEISLPSNTGPLETQYFYMPLYK